jgi:hypothetical protein
MNWYINNAGAAEGPKDDAAMAELVRENKLSLDALVWHAGLDAWQTVAQLSPTWLGGKAAVAEKKAAAGKKDSGVRRLAEPKAPTAEATEEKAGGGFLKRLFGFGKKKS